MPEDTRVPDGALSVNPNEVAFQGSEALTVTDRHKLLCGTLKIHLMALKLGHFHTQKKSGFHVSSLAIYPTLLSLQ